MDFDVLQYISPVAQIAFFALLFVFLIHTLLLSYHWFQYGTTKKTALTALCIYLAGGALLFGALAVSLSYV